MSPADNSKIAVFLLDDHEMVRQGLAQLLSSEPDIEVVGDADNATDAIRMIAELQPDVAVLDILSLIHI